MCGEVGDGDELVRVDVTVFGRDLVDFGHVVFAADDRCCFESAGDIGCKDLVADCCHGLCERGFECGYLGYEQRPADGAMRREPARKPEDIDGVFGEYGEVVLFVGVLGRWKASPKMFLPSEDNDEMKAKLPSAPLSPE